LPVATRAYRLRLLNGSNSRIFKLAWSSGMPMTVLATDGGLLEKAVERPYVTLAPGERIEVWADFRTQPVGTEIKLQSLAYSGVEAGMMEHMATLPNGALFDVLTVKVDKEETETLTLPTQLATMDRYRVADAANQHAPRQFVLSMDSNMNWTINDRTFAMDEVAADEQIEFGALEVWEFMNEMPTGKVSDASNPHAAHSAQGTGTMQMQSTMVGGMQDFMAHPMHLHGVQFQVVERQVAEAQRAGWETVKDGYVDEGWKDTVLIMPGERVKLLVRFADYRGMYVYHCHNLEHEDMGMMRNYLIV
jgi:blue copper oxidase